MLEWLKPAAAAIEAIVAGKFEAMWLGQKPGGVDFWNFRRGGRLVTRKKCLLPMTGRVRPSRGRRAVYMLLAKPARCFHATPQQHCRVGEVAGSSIVHAHSR